MQKSNFILLFEIFGLTRGDHLGDVLERLEILEQENNFLVNQNAVLAEQNEVLKFLQKNFLLEFFYKLSLEIFRGIGNY